MELSTEQLTANSHHASPPVHGSLDPTDWTHFRVQAHRMLDAMIDYTQNIRDRPVWQPVPPPVRARLTASIPTEPTDLAHVHAEFLQNVLPYSVGNVHPGFMGWVHGAGTPVGMLAEMLAAGLNANLGGRDHAPIEVERQVTDWARELFQFPTTASGLFVTGTSMANLVAVLIARDAAVGFAVRTQGLTTSTLTCYAATTVHNSITKALDIAGLGANCLRKIPTDPEGRLDLILLAQAIAADRARGLKPFLVIATAGTVDTGAIDDLSAIATLCHREHLWFHVDGAFGALAILAPTLAPLLNGIDRADSIAFDFHKWGQVPYDSGFLLVRNGTLQRQAFESAPAYLTRTTQGLAAGADWPCDFGPDLSRGFQALKVWFTFKVFGTRALGVAIAQTCELARYLAQRIAETPELELLAPVHLNIVCFRYRSQQADRVNRQIVIDLQLAGSVAPSSTLIADQLAIRAAIVNHRTSSTEIDTLVSQTLIFGRALESAATQHTIANQPPAVHEHSMLQLALSAVQKRLTLESDSPDLLFQQASLLEATGDIATARERYQSLLDRHPTHVGTLNNLGNLLLAVRELPSARTLFERAIAAHPNHLPSRANLGNLLIKSHVPEVEETLTLAAQHFRAALSIDPHYRPAHAGLSFVLGDLGDPTAAAQHRRQAFAGRAVVTARYRGERAPITILELVSTTGGNLRTDDFLSDRVFQRILVTTEFFDSATVLPPHDLVFNAIGEADGASAALAGALAVIARTTAPVLNPPAAVLATGRCDTALRLGRLPGVVAPRTLTFSRASLLSLLVAKHLHRAGFQFPLLLRTPGFHGGDHFVRVDTLAGLPAAVESLPGDNLFVIQYLDARGPDNKTRKFRVMFIDGQLYPLHVAISDHWKIHYFSADMADQPDHRAEDAAFLADMPAVLGPIAISALAAIQQTLGLDYAGIDFGLDPQGQVLLFEANATMAVLVPDRDPRWDYRRPAVERIYRAVWLMLRRRARPHQQAAA